MFVVEHQRINICISIWISKVDRPIRKSRDRVSQAHFLDVLGFRGDGDTVVEVQDFECGDVLHDVQKHEPSAYPQIERRRNLKAYESPDRTPPPSASLRPHVPPIQRCSKT